MTIEGWHLALTAVGVVVPISGMFIGIERSRRKDLDKRLDKKANKVDFVNLEKIVERIEDDCAEKTKELKRDFLEAVNKLDRKFDTLLKEVIDLLKHNKK